jgi:hypothetical protein
MIRSFGCISSIMILGTLASAQSDMRARLAPITSPVRHAGVYHVAAGTWTRGASLARLTGPDTIYNNTCAPVYFTGMVGAMRFQHRSRIPSTTGPTTDSIFYGTTDTDHRYDERPGCANVYVVEGFQVGYCSSHAGTVDWVYEFASSYTACGGASLVPQYTFMVTGLPGGTPSGAQRCWTVDIDVSGMPGGGFALSADGDGHYDGPSTADQFGWSFGTVGATAADFTGPLIAGDFTWTGGPGTTSGTLTPCTGADGTMWDRPAIDLREDGTGMASNNFFRCHDCPGPPSSMSCYYFGGNPHADFHLKLYALAPCTPDIPGFAFCAPGVGGVVTCPCGNPQVPADSTKGCDNFVSGGTGGAVLAGTGTPSLAFDSVVLTASAEAPAVTITVLFQGTSNGVNLRTGAGVRCVGGASLKRLYKGNSSGGAIQFPNDAVSFHDQSAAKGFPITPPITLYYYGAYRNAAANGQPGCPGLTFGFNATNAGAVSWVP